MESLGPETGDSYDLYADLVPQVEQFLSSQHLTLWGRAFDVVSDNGRADAADWFARQFIAFVNHAEAVTL